MTFDGVHICDCRENSSVHEGKGGLGGVNVGRIGGRRPIGFLVVSGSLFSHRHPCSEAVVRRRVC